MRALAPARAGPGGGLRPGSLLARREGATGGGKEDAAAGGLAGGGDEDDDDEEEEEEDGDARARPGLASGSLPYPEGGRRAWLVVGGAFSGMMAAFGVVNSMGVFQAYLVTHQLAGYSEGAVGWIFGVHVFLVRMIGG